MPEDHVKIKISKKLYGEIEKRVKESRGEFKNAQEYIEFILAEVVKEDEKTETVYTPQEEEEIKKRLKRLGYL